MQNPYHSDDPADQFGLPPPRQGSRVWLWLLGITALVVVLPCGGCLGFLVYMAAVGPETSVYTGIRPPWASTLPACPPSD
jgi:hypothetical protein